MPREVVDGFDDHTVSRIETVAEFGALARSGVSRQTIVKFAIPDMMNATDVRWMDSNFYSLHDEWYWFRLLNGRTVPGFDTSPFFGPSFDTIDGIVTWADQFSELPLGLRFVDSRTYGKRLYAPNFYAEGLPDDRRNFGLGGLIFLPDAADGRDHWLIEMEFSDAPSPEEVDRYFDLIEATVPDEIGAELEWVIRSPAQDAVARSMVESAVPRHDRIVRWTDLIAPGETAVYNAGLTAGRLLLVDGVNTVLGDASERDIVLIEDVPDRLPPAAALLTSSPQTPLAHVNLLARNRGIPNASRAGLLDDASLQQAARVRAPAIVRATALGELEIVLITDDEYEQWRSLRQPALVSVPPVDARALPLVLSLTELADGITSEADVDPLRPVIGGKSAGFLALLGAPGVTTPLDPLAITVRPYVEHLDQVAAELDEMLGFDDFERDAEVRFLFLEGPEDFLEEFPDSAPLVERLLKEQPVGTPLGEILRAEGFQRYLRDRPIDPSTLAAIVDRLRQSYGGYADSQGIRFRSSSSVEDIEGFTGAGLYDSNTGFLVPDPEDDDRDKTVEEAILETWASYWSFEAFEERRLERIDHTSGGMGVTVHARFDDALEKNNGVATFTLLPDADGDQSTMSVNVQAGDLSVANPDEGELPEVNELRRSDGGELRIARLATSSVADPAVVMPDDRLIELFDQLEAVSLLWRDRVNASLPDSEHVTTVTLDFEFKTMAAGWPAIEGEPPLPARLVVKQARTLDPGLRDVPADVLTLPIPRDILARASSVRRTCRADGDTETALFEVITDPTRLPDMGHSVEPFTVEVAGEGCRETTLLATPAQFLTDVLASRPADR